MEKSEPAPVDVRVLLKRKRCHTCHDDSKQLLGPSYEAIGAAYSERKDDMAEVLARKIVDGGSGNWGVVPMVPNEHVTIDEARSMTSWILEFKPPQQ